MHVTLSPVSVTPRFLGLQKTRIQPPVFFNEALGLEYLAAYFKHRPALTRHIADFSVSAAGESTYSLAMVWQLRSPEQPLVLTGYHQDSRTLKAAQQGQFDLEATRPEAEQSLPYRHQTYNTQLSNWFLPLADISAQGSLKRKRKPRPIASLCEDKRAQCQFKPGHIKQFSKFFEPESLDAVVLRDALAGLGKVPKGFWSSNRTIKQQRVQQYSQIFRHVYAGLRDEGVLLLSLREMAQPRGAEIAQALKEVGFRPLKTQDGVTILWQKPQPTLRKMSFKSLKRPF